MSQRPPGSSTAPEVDLDVLRRSPSAPARARRPLLPRLLLVLLATGVGVALYGAFVKPLLFPPRQVRLVSVRPVTGAAALQRRALATAAGWLEAEPFPTTVRPLVSGVVSKLEVLEGQRVRSGETVIAVLANPELDNALATAEAQLEVKRSLEALALARVTVARSLLAQKLDLRAAQIGAEVEVRRDRESLAEAQAALAYAEANVQKARVEAEAQRSLRDTGGTPPISVRLAEAALLAVEAERSMRVAAVARARVELEQHERALALADEALAAPAALTGALDVAEHEQRQAAAERGLAEVERDVARRNVDLLTVRSPADGVVLRLMAAVGAPAGPGGEMREPLTIGPGSTGAIDVAGGSLALLYDPAHLQARVEVPLADVGGIAPGTEASLEVEAVPGRTFKGEVLRLLSEANIQNNKLWVKVRLLETDGLLRPEMLCRAKFLAQQTQGPGGAAGPTRLAVPASALLGDTLFVYDPRGEGRARRIAVTRRGETDGWVEVEGPLGLSNEVILEPQGLEDGVAVRAQRGGS